MEFSEHFPSNEDFRYHTDKILVLKLISDNNMLEYLHFIHYFTSFFLNRYVTSCNNTFLFPFRNRESNLKLNP